MHQTVRLKKTRRSDEQELQNQKVWLIADGMTSQTPILRALSAFDKGLGLFKGHLFLGLMPKF